MLSLITPPDLSGGGPDQCSLPATRAPHSSPPLAAAPPGHGDCARFPLHQQLLGRDEPAIELTKLVIDSNTESLEGPSCRVLSPLKFRHRGTHDFGEFDRTSNGPVMPCCGNRARNPAGEAFLAELANQFGQLAFGQGSNQIRSACTLAAHPHIEGPVKAKRKAALGSVELHRGNAQIESNAGDRLDGHGGE